LSVGVVVHAYEDVRLLLLLFPAGREKKEKAWFYFKMLDP
jgi:hypothetical protein